ISTRERQKRLMAGGVQAAVALVVLAVLLTMRANRWWRLALFPIFGGAAAGYFQWQDPTLVGPAARRARKTGDPVEAMADTAQLAQVRRQARTVNIKSLTIAATLTLLALLLPGSE